MTTLLNDERTPLFSAPGRQSRIARIEISHHQFELDPPFPAAWDSQPRRQFPATLVRVIDSEGREGIGSGDVMYGFDDFRHLFIGEDPLDLERHAGVIDNIGFHAGRCWPLEVALWDLAGKILESPVWRLMGGVSNRLRAYASSGTHRPLEEVVALAEQVRDAGIPALKLRFGRAHLEEDLAVLGAVRQAVGSRLELMVDCNQGWRMPWDVKTPWQYAHALEVARELEHQDVYWMEEPLYRGDYAGMARLAEETKLRIAGGEMTREPYEFREMLRQGCLDVYQPDAVCSVGMLGLARLAREIVAAGKAFTPHTWGNGIGVVANLHLTAGAVGPAGAPYLEYPFDPPEWTPEKRDFPLAAPLLADSDGWLTLSEAPGLGLTLDEDRLAATRATQATYQ
ncbi:mandelate racemase/muconate lactonizing enzyme family protein [Halomonas nitroreducens]|uniref:Mandelate racemase/muconate lactonizing enzyme family protein n=1 Tax=Halomonas nitroreducens TaxID=447425 RepID=A0A431V2H8_9GAMM|nr:mandelate racemase/muconate lactonizing enzyme family protein [Halomonas nitroreducens]RTR02956.1 mandelate racemase/muconate lactonizing enzyme family protein [Halomonas nitroreducens]